VRQWTSTIDLLNIPFSKVNSMQKSSTNRLFKAVFELPTGLKIPDLICIADDNMKSGVLLGTLSKNTYKTYNAQIKGFLNWFDSWDVGDNGAGTKSPDFLWGLLWSDIFNPFAVCDLYLGILFYNYIVYQCLPQLYSNSCPSLPFRRNYEANIIHNTFTQVSTLQDDVLFFNSPTKGCSLATARTTRKTIVEFLTKTLAITPTHKDTYRYNILNDFLVKVSPSLIQIHATDTIQRSTTSASKPAVYSINNFLLPFVDLNTIYIHLFDPNGWTSLSQSLVEWCAVLLKVRREL
jgi:hypothetical protein